jgi:hypothetical protein
MNDTDIVSVVMTVKSAKELLAALTGKVLPSDSVANVTGLALTAALTPKPMNTMHPGVEL